MAISEDTVWLDPKTNNYLFAVSDKLPAQLFTDQIVSASLVS